MDFLDRARPIFGQEGFDVLRQKEIAFAGLGGVGGGAFLALVRCGASRFRLAENGVFDPPDMNRQAAAFGHTMDRPKLDVYMELARSINPDIEMTPYPEGLQPDNLDEFLEGADAYVSVIDVEKGHEVKAMTTAMLKKHDIPLFTCGAIGFGAIMINYAPDGMTNKDFWALAEAQGKTDLPLPASLLRHFSPAVAQRMAEGFAAGVLSTTAIGGLASNTLLAHEVLTYLLAGTGLMERAPVFAPQYVALDFTTMNMTVADITVTE